PFVITAPPRTASQKETNWSFKKVYHKLDETDRSLSASNSPVTRFWLLRRLSPRHPLLTGHQWLRHSRQPPFSADQQQRSASPSTTLNPLHSSIRGSSPSPSPSPPSWSFSTPPSPTSRFPTSPAASLSAPTKAPGCSPATSSPTPLCSHSPRGSAACSAASATT